MYITSRLVSSELTFRPLLLPSSAALHLPDWKMAIIPEISSPKKGECQIIPLSLLQSICREQWSLLWRRLSWLHLRSSLLLQVERYVLHPGDLVTSAEPTLLNLVTSNTYYHTGLPGSAEDTHLQVEDWAPSSHQEPLAPSFPPSLVLQARELGLPIPRRMWPHGT